MKNVTSSQSKHTQVQDLPEQICEQDAEFLKPSFPFAAGKST